MRIGIDEISYRRGHKYLMVVVDHDTGRLVWGAFFTEDLRRYLGGDELIGQVNPAPALPRRSSWPSMR